jgi:hypothetical protein
MSSEYRIGDDETIGTAVVHAVCEFKDCAPTAVPPLQETIDADGLKRLTADGFASTPYIAFYYADCHVAVHGDRISVSAESAVQFP